MENSKIKLTASEIGSLWGQYINGTMNDIINKYMFSIMEDDEIKAVFKEAIDIFAKQKEQIVKFIEMESFAVPIGFTEYDLHKDTKRLFTDIFCLNYLHIMTIHGLVGHTTSLGVSIREDLRKFSDQCGNDAKIIYHKTIDLLLQKGDFQRDPYFYPSTNPEYISSTDFTDGFLGKGRRLAATEVITISYNLKKSIMAKSLCIAFSQVAQSTEVREFFTYSQKTADKNITAFSKILQADNLPAPKSLETEITISTDSPFSDKLMMYHIGFLSQVAQAYYGAGLAASMRMDLIAAYERDHHFKKSSGNKEMV